MVAIVTIEEKPGDWSMPKINVRMELFAQVDELARVKVGKESEAVVYKLTYLDYGGKVQEKEIKRFEPSEDGLDGENFAKKVCYDVLRKEALQRFNVKEPHTVFDQFFGSQDHIKPRPDPFPTYRVKETKK